MASRYFTFLKLARRSIRRKRVLEVSKSFNENLEI